MILISLLFLTVKPIRFRHHLKVRSSENWQYSLKINFSYYPFTYWRDMSIWYSSWVLNLEWHLFNGYLWPMYITYLRLGCLVMKWGAELDHQVFFLLSHFVLLQKYFHEKHLILAQHSSGSWGKYEKIMRHIPCSARTFDLVISLSLNHTAHPQTKQTSSSAGT